MRPALLLAIAAALPALADTPDRALLQAALIVTSFDRLDATCAGRYTPPQRDQVQRWAQENDLAAVRSQLPALRAQPRLAAQLDRAAQQIEQMARDKGANACAAAASLTQLPDARLARAAETPAPATQTPPPSTDAAAAETTPAAAVPADVLARIDSFAFDTRPKMGLGGFIALDIYPVMLFKGGELLTEVKGLRDARGLAGHRAAHPEQWSQWRRQGGQVQVRKDGRWEKLPFDNTYAQLPGDLRLSGRYRSTSGVGNVAVGGQQSVTVVDEYRFSPDGRVVRSGAVGSTAQAGGTSVVTRGGPGERSGRYRLDGLLLRIDYDDGRKEQRVLITDPAKPGGVLWLDGESYVERR
ncbi:MAG: hypothetical protein K9J82_12920 [Methylotenera sp.]|jgi:hypothetical protein|nr:hypothetical protein [Methylotenera sp.]